MVVVVVVVVVLGFSAGESVLVVDGGGFVRHRVSGSLSLSLVGPGVVDS